MAAGSELQRLGTAKHRWRPTLARSRQPPMARSGLGKADPSASPSPGREWLTDAFDTSVPEHSRPEPGPSGQMAARSRRDVLGVLWVVAAGLVVLLPALIHGGSLSPYQLLPGFGVFEHARVPTHGNLQQSQDLLLLSIPWHALAWTQIHSGHLPLWNPYNVLGMPLAFNWESAPFSLQSLIGYLGPLRLVLTISIVCNLVIGGTGAYFLCRVLRLGVLGAAMAGTVYELSGPFFGLLGWQDPAVMCWTGWLFAVTILILRGRHRFRCVAAFAVVLALAGYAGQPEELFLLGLAVGIFVVAIFLARLFQKESVRSFLRPIADLAVAGVAGLALFAPVALPALQLSRISVRSKWEPIDNVSAAQARLHALTNGKNVGQALSLHDLTHVLFQTFDGLPVTGGSWFSDRFLYFDSAAYVGVIAVVLAIVAVGIRRRNAVVIAFAVMTACMFCLVFVPPVVSAVDRLPVVGTFLWNRALIPMCFGIAVLAGVGTDLVVQRHSDRRVRVWIGAGFVVAAALLGALWLFGRGHLPAAEAAIRADSFFWPVAATLAGLGMAAGLWRIAAHPSTGSPGVPTHRVGQLAGGALLVVETAFLVASALPLASSSPQFLPTTPASSALQRAAGPAVVAFGSSDCIFPPALGIKPNLNAAYRIQELAVYDPMTPLAYFTSWQDANGQTGGYLEDNIFCPAVTSATMARRYGVSLVLEPAHAPAPSGTVYDGKIGDEALYRVPDAGVATVSPMDRDGRLPGPDAPGTPVDVSHPDPASWLLRTDGTAPQVLRLRLTSVPGWHASIDGRPLALLPFSGIMLQAVVPSGRHVIELHYWPTTFTAGLVLACCSVVGLTAAGVVALVVGRRRRSRS